MVEVDNSAYGKTMDNLSGWLCSEEEVLPAIQLSLTLEKLGYGKLTDRESAIYIVYKMFLNGDI